MADDDQNDQQNQQDGTEEIDDSDAEQLLADAVETSDDAESDTDETATDSTDWKAEATKWKRLSRQNEKTAKTTAEKLREYENRNKSDAERLQEDRDAHKTRAEKAEQALRKREVAEEFAPEHATVAQIRAVAKRLTGDDDDELEADARELFDLLAPAKSRTATRPQERLRGGADPDEPVEETDPRKLAAQIPRTR